MGDGGIQWDAPNQQVVRDDASPPWQEGTGGNTEEPVSAKTRSKKKTDNDDDQADPAEETEET